MAEQTLAELYRRKPVKGFSGLYARSRRDGGKTYYLATKSGWTNLGHDKEVAVRRYEELRPRVRKGEDVATATKVTFDALAQQWIERRKHELDTRTLEHYEWALGHLLPTFGSRKLSEIGAEHVRSYMAAKLKERERRESEIAEWSKADPKTRGRMPKRGLSNASINKCLKVLAQVLEEAVEDGYLAENVARGTKRRLKAAKPKRTWLELHEVQVLLKAAGKHRALLATMTLAGLRVSELTALRWRDVDLAAGRLRVRESKTEAGERIVDVSPMLRDELAVHRADSERSGLDDLVFGTSQGTERNRSNITRQILQPAIARANVELEQAGRPPIEGLTNHSLRRTFAALLYEAGESPKYVMEQMGHSDPKLALEIYAKVIRSERQDRGERMDALVRGEEIELPEAVLSD